MAKFFKMRYSWRSSLKWSTLKSVCVMFNNFTCKMKRAWIPILSTTDVFRFMFNLTKHPLYKIESTCCLAAGFDSVRSHMWAEFVVGSPRILAPRGFFPGTVLRFYQSPDQTVTTFVESPAMLRPFDILSQQCWEMLWHVEKSLNSFKLCLNIFTTFLLFLKCWEVVEVVWPGMVTTCHNKCWENVETNFVTVSSGLYSLLKNHHCQISNSICV